MPSAVFARLPSDLTLRFEQAEAKREDRPGRRPGAGRMHSLELGDRLLMLLIY